MTASGQSRIYREQHGGANATEVVASGGVIRVEPGGSINGATNTGAFVFATGEIQSSDLAGDLASGIIPLGLMSARVKTTATASGLTALSTGTNPKLHNVETTDNRWALEVLWSSAAGATNQLQFDPVPIPHDYATAGGLTFHAVGRITSGQSTAGTSGKLNVRVYQNTVSTTGQDDEASGTVAFTSSPTEQTRAVASGSIPSTGFINTVLAPEPHASGSMALYGAWYTYTRTS